MADMKISLHLVIYFLGPLFAEKKIWNFDNDVMNPKNWEKSEDCDGIHFPEVLGSIGSITHVKTGEIYLPITGELELQNGADVEFSSEADAQKCVRVKRIPSHRWLDPRNWQYQENAARPDAEKVPCIYDDVIFPIKDTAVFYPEVAVSVKSVQLKGITLRDDAEWQNFLASDYGVEQFHERDRKGGVKIVSKECGPRTWCTCHDNFEETSSWICDGLPNNDARCFEPIQPVGFCESICGGVVYLNVTAEFVLEELQKRLPSQVDVYASKILIKERPMVQVVFADKSEYSEDSAKIARKFYETVLEDLVGYRVLNAKVQTSGIRMPLGSPAVNALQILSGTLVAAVVIFLVVYTMYSGPLRDYDFASRVPITQFLSKKRRQYFFNKFDNREMSRATSMISLERAFEALPSTSSGITVENIKSEGDSNETIESTDEAIQEQ